MKPDSIERLICWPAPGLSQAFDVPLQVIGENGEVVAAGTVNGPAIELAAGSYIVQIPLSESEHAVSLNADEPTVVTLNGN